MFYCIIKALILFSYELYCREYRIILDEYPYTNYFFSGYLSNFMHYGYYAMYVNVAILLLLEYLGKSYNSITIKWKILYILTLLFLSIFVMMLYSKAGIISLLLIYLFFGIYLALLHKKIKYLLFTIITLSSILYILFNFIPYTSERISGMVKGFEHKDINPDSDESTQLRIFAWQASTNLIKSNPISGYGTGDVNDELIKEYKNKGYTGALRKEMNAHNQYYQTMLGIGIFGLILFVVFYFWNGYLAIKQRSFSLFIFVIITFFIMLFESYLETQAGVFYTSIFSTLLILKSTSDGVES
jgi:O-antigen ligase